MPITRVLLAELSICCAEIRYGLTRYADVLPVLSSHPSAQMSDIRRGFSVLPFGCLHDDLQSTYRGSIAVFSIVSSTQTFANLV